jgi:hypothetical protein
MKAKATKETVRARVEDILRVRLDGAQFFQICEHVRKKEREGAEPWAVPEGGKPLSESQLRRYSQRADELMAESCRARRGKLLREHAARRLNLYARALNKGDERTALAVLDSLAKLQGVFPTGDEALVKELAGARRELAELKARGARSGDGNAQAGGEGTDPGHPGGAAPGP